MDLLKFILFVFLAVHQSYQDVRLDNYLKYCWDSGYYSGWNNNENCDFGLENVPSHVLNDCIDVFKNSCSYARKMQYCIIGKDYSQKESNKCEVKSDNSKIGSELIYKCCIACKLGSDYAKTKESCDQLLTNNTLPSNAKVECCKDSLELIKAKKECTDSSCLENKFKRNQIGNDKEVDVSFLRETSDDLECFGEGYWVNPQTGKCEDINECETNQHNCRIDEVCENSEGSFECKKSSDSECKIGFKKVEKGCQDINECEDGTHNCDLLQICKNYEGGFWCIEKNVTDDFSEKITDTITYTLDTVDLNKGNLLNSSTSECDKGYEYNLTLENCQDIDECAFENMCEEGKKCVNIDGSFECKPTDCLSGFSLVDGVCNSAKCKPGYTFDLTFNNCVDIDECKSGHNCTHLEKCRNREGSFECFCKNGYQKNENGQCIDIDECLDGKNLCSPVKSNCKNLDGSYECVCKKGFEKEKDGENCVDIDECKNREHNCKQDQNCENTEGNYICKENLLEEISNNTFKTTRQNDPCPEGFDWNLSLKMCEDIDECKKKDICEKGTICVNQIGTFECIKLKCPLGSNFNETSEKCECQSVNSSCSIDLKCEDESCTNNNTCTFGTKLNDFGDCEDIDECTQQTHNCSTTEQCINLNGSYKCDCLKGYKKEDKKCVDIDECNTSLACSFDSTCKNTNGSFECICNKGFRKNENGDCLDIDECSESIDNCSHTCFNLYGGFNCRCFTGFEMDENQNCVDINECEKYSDICFPGNCTNKIGSYECECPAGYKLTKIGCIKINEKCSEKCTKRDECQCSNIYEIDENGQFQDINECEKDVCRSKDEVCLNLFGSYKCLNLHCKKDSINDYKSNQHCIKKFLKSKDEPFLENIKTIKIPKDYQVPKDGLILYIMKSPKKLACQFKIHKTLVNVIPKFSENAASKEDFILITNNTLANLVLKTTLTVPQDIITTIDCKIKGYDNVFRRTHIHTMITQ